MGVFYHEEPQKPLKRCKYLAATLKEAFSHCQSPGRQLSSASLDEDFPVSDLDEEQEVVLSAVRSRAIEKQKKHKPSLFLYVTQTMAPPQAREGGGGGGGGGDEQQEESEEFLSVKSCFSCCPSSNAMMSNDEAFYSVRTNLSRCSSMNEVDLSEYWRGSIIHEFLHCEGWPFGLCRKAVLLPPLPKSPSESWLSRKIQRGSKDA